MKAKKSANTPVNKPVGAPVKKPFPSYAIAVAVVAILAVIAFIFIQQGNAPVAPPVAAPAAPPVPQAEPIVGGDRDAHGCIGSAGYVWCDSLSQCIRPWETNCTSSAMPPVAAPPILPAAVPPAPPVAQPAAPPSIDAHGCTTSSGFIWCELKGKCLHPAKENCTTIASADAFKYCDAYDHVLICGDYIRATNDVAGSSVFFYKKGSTTPIICPPATQSLSDECRNLIFNMTCIVPVLC